MSEGGHFVSHSATGVRQPLWKTVMRTMRGAAMRNTGKCVASVFGCGAGYVAYQGWRVFLEEGSGGFYSKAPPIPPRRLKELDGFLAKRGESRVGVCSHISNMSTELVAGNDTFASQLSRVLFGLEEYGGWRVGDAHKHWVVERVDPHRITGSRVYFRDTRVPGHYKVVGAKKGNGNVQFHVTELYSNTSYHSADLWPLTGIPRRIYNKTALGTALPKLTVCESTEESYVAWLWRQVKESNPITALPRQVEQERLKRLERTNEGGGKQ